MQIQPSGSPSSQFPMLELELIESIIKACSQWLTRPQWLAILECRLEALLAELEIITRPQSFPARPVMKTISRGFEYRGIVYARWNKISIHIDLLRYLWTDFPDRREAMARAMGRDSRIRPYVARTLAELFPGQTPAFASRHGRPLVDDWYVDTNLNPRQMPAILSAAVATAGFELGKEVKLYWRQTQIK
ncbi:hypothetical protein [Nitrosospira sp. Is2]|uniref:hypothetical protein n=1 Tax=Nitrosospira sp. Is2 TaxID=3080532 RepID=UPI002953D43A|nr:hypothetical protein [Nitrosospira sp. Is2]WON72894.1 hypothetical protein R5L00_10350 [Nitrosospira sp. Is2]